MPDLPTEIWLEIGAVSIALDSTAERVECVSLAQLSQTCRHFQSIYASTIETRMHERLRESSMVDIALPRLDDLDDRERLDPTATPDKFRPGRSYQLLRFRFAHDDGMETRPIKYLVSRAKLIDTIEVEMHKRVTRAIPALASFLNLCVGRTENLVLRPYHTRHIRDCPTGALEGSPFDFTFHPFPLDEPHEPPTNPTLEYLLSGSFRSLTKAREQKRRVHRPGSWHIEPKIPAYTVPLPSTQASRCVKSLELHADELFSPSMYCWVSSMLNSSLIITRLSISVPLTIYHWEHILPTLYLRKLEHITFLSIPHEFAHILAFLNRHSTLRSLEVINSVVDVEADETVTIPKEFHQPSFLPSLRNIIATPEYILPFFMQHRSGHLYNLTTYELRGCSYDVQPNGAPFPSGSGRREHRTQFFDPIFERLAEDTLYIQPGSTNGGTDTDKALHLKLYTMSLVGLVEWFTHQDEPKPLFAKKRQMNDVHTITIVYTNGYLPPPPAMYLLRPWVRNCQALKRAYETATEESHAKWRGINIERDVWLLHLFLCHVFPDLERIISEYRGRKDIVEVDRSLFD